MKIAVEGCAHGELEKIYDTVKLLEKKNNIKIDLLICCGDFQSTRNMQDLHSMAVPQNYRQICTFYKYYSGEKIAPCLTIFIGGNHEASNYLQELPYGGWVAPNIYYLGYAGVINIAGVRIGGISGIYKASDYRRGRFEKIPYDESSKRSVYHIRNLDVFRLKQLSGNIDIFLSHDWPQGVYHHGNVNKLLSDKPFFKADIESNQLGSPPCKELLEQLKPSYWFSAHLHCKFAAIIPHSEAKDSENRETKFLGLDKCLPKRKFLQIVDVPHNPNSNIKIKYDLEWLTILFLTNHLLSTNKSSQYMPGHGSNNRWKFTPTKEETEFVLEKFGCELAVPLDFTPTAPAYDPNEYNSHIPPTYPQINEQTKLFCEKLAIDDPVSLLLKASINDSMQSDCNTSSYNNSSLNNFVPKSVEIKYNRLNISLPVPKIDVASPISKLNLTLPPPKNPSDGVGFKPDVSSSDRTISDPNTSSSIVGTNMFPKNTTDDFETEVSELDRTNPDTILNSNITGTNMFSDFEISTSTPQIKKFKRRNESIYKSN